MPKTKVEVYDKDQLIYPFIESDHITFSNGMKITEMLDQSISMPKVTHEDSSFKVGVGDQDVSSAIVDSSVADMTIKGQTYQNILPDPTLRNEMQGKSMQRLNEGYDSIEAVDGVSKSAILKGQTLVNVDSYYSKDDFVDRHILNLTDDGWVEMVANGNYRNAFTRFNGMIKPNTKYLAVVEVKENTLVNETLPERPFYLFTNFSNSDGEVVVPFVDQTRWISQGQKGLFKYILTSRGDLSTTTINLRNFVSNTTTSGRIIYRTMLIEYVEGMENWDIPFFRGIQYVKMPVLTTTGKNLFELPQSDKMLKGSIGKYIKLNLKPNTNYTYNSILDKKGNTAEFDFYGWISNDTNSNFTGYEVFHWKLNKTFSKTFNTGNDEWYFHVYGEQKGDDYRNYLINFQLEQGSTATSYEPYKSNILTVNEPVELRGIGKVKDELNLLTGELTQRIGEVVFDGVSTHLYDSQVGGNETLTYRVMTDMIVKEGAEQCLADAFPSNVGNENGNGTEGVRIIGNRLYLYIYKTRLSNPSQSGVMEYLKSNPMKVQYPMSQEVVKTVDLSSSGNWEKIVLDGSDNYTWGIADKTTFWQCKCENAITNMREGALCFGQGDKSIEYTNTAPNKPYQVHINAQPRMVFTLPKDVFKDSSEFKQYLSQNPITVWYQTVTQQDNSIREMLSFANGHLQVSSEAENSLLPSVQYEIPTKNSYHMDLMKTNTLYTMKAKTVSGTFTIDGTSYNVNTNGTFTTPTSMTDKLLIMSNKTNEEVMLLEGNVIDKTIPYFKGIKSAFEGEDKIEVLSTGKNLVDLSKGYHFASESDVTVSNNTVSIKGNNTWTRFMIPVYLKANTRYTLTYNTSNAEGNVTVRIKSDGSGDFKGGNFLNTWGDGVYYVSLNTTTHVGWVHFSNIQLIEDSEGRLQYEPYKSNSTKIPLLSPLRSLPNGVYDEIILNRENNNVKMIRRVGRVVLNGEEDWTHEDKWHRWYSSCMNMARVNDYATMILNNSENLPVIKNNTILRDDTYGISGYELTSNYPNQNWIYIRPKNVSNTQALQSLLSQNPITVLYELATPIITEVDLEGFPYIYKDGHIFLNSDIAPTTQITYSINQAQQIESANENLQRHEKEISRLQKLIAQYIQVEYESTLLSLKI